MRQLAAASDATLLVHQSEAVAVASSATVTFDVGIGEMPPDPMTANLGARITLPTPTSRTGFTFAGWFDAKLGGTRVGGAGERYTVSADSTLYARWSRIPVAVGPPVSVGPPPQVETPVAPPRVDVRPPRIEMPVESQPDPRRPAVAVVDGEEVELVIESDAQNTGLEASIGDFVLSVAASDVSRNRIAPTERRSLVAPVRGWIDVNAAGYAPNSVVGLYLVPQVSSLRTLRLMPRMGIETLFLGEAVVGDNQLLSGEFRIPDWATAGEYSLQINGYTPAGSLKSINVRLDLIDQRADAVSAARACVFPESSTRLTPECRRSLRSLRDLLPAEIDTLKIDVTGVAYAQGSKKRNREVALERGSRVRGFLERNGVRGEITVDVVSRKGLAPGITLGPPPVVVAENGKPASTVVLTVEWTTEVGPDGVSLR